MICEPLVPAKLYVTSNLNNTLQVKKYKFCHYNAQRSDHSEKWFQTSIFRIFISVIKSTEYSQKIVRTLGKDSSH